MLGCTSLQDLRVANDALATELLRMRGAFDEVGLGSQSC